MTWQQMWKRCACSHQETFLARPACLETAYPTYRRRPTSCNVRCTSVPILPCPLTAWPVCGLLLVTCHVVKPATRPLQQCRESRKCIAALQLDAVTAERNSLHEDLINHRDSKRTVDKQWRLERERCERLESELAFYQNHSAQALSDRDKVKRWLSS